MKVIPIPHTIFRNGLDFIGDNAASCFLYYHATDLLGKVLRLHPFQNPDLDTDFPKYSKEKII